MKLKIGKHLLLLFLLFLLSLSVQANEINHTIRFTHLTNDNGLPGNSVYTLFQDYKGFIWIGTKNGLCKYDGRSISEYETEGLIDGIKKQGGQIRDMLEDNQQRLWVVTQKGINQYDRKKDRFNLVGVDSIHTSFRVIYQDEENNIYLGGSGLFIFNEKEQMFEPFYFNEEKILASITAITSDKKGQLWLGRMYGGLICIDIKSGKLSRFRHNEENNNSLIADKIVTLYTDRYGNVWVGTEKGICYFDDNSKKFVTIEGFPQVCVRSFGEAPDGNLWIGSEDGLYIYNPGTKQFFNYKQDYNDKYSLNDNAIYTIFRDREDNMLIGTYFGGINIFPNTFRQFFYYDYGYSERSLSGKAVRQILGDQAGNLWIATEDGGLNYYDRETKRFNHFKPDSKCNSLSYHNVHSLLLDKNENLWIGTFLGGLNKYNLKTKQFTYYSVSDYPNMVSDNIFSLLEDKDGEIWIGTTNGLAVYNPERNSFRRFETQIIGSKSIDNLYEDSDGDIWIGARSHGVYRYNKSMQSLQNFSYKSDGTGISDNFINYVFEDRKKNIWIGTHEGGLCRFNKQTELFTVYTKKQGLPSNTIFGITESEEGNLWISTNDGLSCLNIENQTFTNYSVSEGLPNKQFNYNSVYKASDGLLYFGTINGMIAFYPENLQTIQNVAKVEFTDFKTLGKSVIPGEENSPLNINIEEVGEIHLSSEQAKSFTFEFTVPTISHPTSTFFAIKFNNDKDWTYIGTQNQLTYANLPQGEYLLCVKAAFNNKWEGNEPVKTVKIVIAPPFWKSDIAYVLYFIFLCGLSIAFYLFIRKRQQEKNLILSERMEKEKMKEINTLKLNFFTNISHELRTPLSLILIPLQSFLEKNVFSPEILPKMKLIAGNARRMNNLVEELMFFSKIETRQEKIRVKKGNLLNFIAGISEGFQVLAEEKGLEYIQEIDCSNENVWFAPVKVEKIVYNLLSNAFKYTDSGKITIKAFYEYTSDYTYLNLIVSDTGVGIAADHKEKIFENYYQVNDFVKSAKAGFGIGLALTRELVLLHKGDIRVESQLGAGSVFSIKLNVSVKTFAPDEISNKDADEQFLEGYKYLPVNKSVQEDKDASNEAIEREIQQEQYKLLVVEDNEELLLTYEELFRDTYTVITAKDGKEGYASARKHLPDIIISDVMMPEMNGFELARKLKSRIETCHIPVLLLTARTGEEAQMQGYDSGADLYVEKPFHPSLLQKQISNLIVTKENQKKLYVANKIEMSDIKANDKDKKLIADIESFVLNNLDNNDFSLNYLLRELGIGRTLLHVKLKNIVGLSTTEFINNVRLKESLKILASGKNVSEAAYATGFSSPNYYSRCFKKFFSMSPNEYLMKLNEQEKEQKSEKNGE